jgi:hypothetical protein
MLVAVLCAALTLVVPPLLPDSADAPVGLGLAALGIRSVFLAERAGRRSAG